MLGAVGPIKAVKPGMVGEDSCGQGTALNAHGGDDGQRHRDGAAAKAGKVIDDCDLFLVIVHGPFFFPWEIIFNYIRKKLRGKGPLCEKSNGPAIALQFTADFVRVKEAIY